MYCSLFLIFSKKIVFCGRNSALLPNTQFHPLNHRLMEKNSQLFDAVKDVTLYYVLITNVILPICDRLLLWKNSGDLCVNCKNLFGLLLADSLNQFTRIIDNSTSPAIMRLIKSIFNCFYATFTISKVISTALH